MPREVLSSQSRKLVLNVLEYFQNKKEVTRENISVIKCASEALKLSERTISRIRKEGIDGISRGHMRNRKAPKTRDITEAQNYEVRKVVYDLTEKKQYVTRQKIREELISRQIMTISTSSLGVILKNLGFKYKIDNGRRALMERPEIISKRVKFLRSYMQNLSSDCPLDVVFLDETWVFQHGSDIRTWHDSNPKSVFNKKGNEGKRFVIVHAGNKDGFIDGAGLIFSTKNKSADYHDNMNSELFEKWLEENFLPKLERPSLIIMDNARYHCRLSENVPNTSSRKEEIIDWLRHQNIEFPPHAFKCELFQYVKQYKAKLPYAVDVMISNMGHEVLRLPPYHCIFNAIELIWAHCKEVYNKNMVSFQTHDHNAVLNMWNHALESVTKKNWSDSIQHTENIIREFWRKENILDVVVQPLIINLNDDSSSSDLDSDEEDIDVL